MAKARVKVDADDVAQPRASLRRSTRNSSKGGGDVLIKHEDIPATTLVAPVRRSKRPRSAEDETVKAEPPTKIAKRSSSSSPSASPVSSRVKVQTEAPSPKKKHARSVKAEKGAGGKENNNNNSSDKAADLRAKKLKSYTQFANKSPFPDFARPSPEECERAYGVLAALHGERRRPEKVVSAPADRAGCGDAPSVLDALVRTILSQNTSNRNSTRAKLDMDAVYGGGESEERWERIAAGGAAKLEKAIARGGLGGVKSRAIVEILRQVRERYGKYSLDHLLLRTTEAEEEGGGDEEAMRELISFKGVGPKTASCVLLFCVGRDSFAVDTHVHRLTGMLGWRPATASRDETFAHLDVRIPDQLKYGLHVLFVEHGRKCPECKAGGKVLGKCELRKAFKRGKVKVEGQMEEGEVDRVKKEEEEAEEEEEEKGAKLESTTE
ncbi:DNA glycosylase [Annulohypoxylon truncatum]|uniref:DNA glycosylase n=1 Tax=Annulohypoxylon truncatum TaxID=327061 RepID=UPI002007A4DB|nr:DNA glycosylase [Annulohypoxylon truncatum]KAI1204484.1 DNA glycosylase [Annulohypoxylon truncatum]